MSIESLVHRCELSLRTAGVFGLLRDLNLETPYRFTGIYRFEENWVRSVWLYDRETPERQYGSDVLWDASYCRMTAANGDACEITNSTLDPRLKSHAARDTVQSYVAVLLRHPMHQTFGTLCHYDTEPRVCPPHALACLRAVRPLLEQALHTELAASRERQASA